MSAPPPNGQDPVDALLREARLNPAEAAALADLLHAVAPNAAHLPAGSPGEYAALAAFRSAHRETASRPLGAFAMYRNRTRAALLTAKTAAAALVLVSAGGVAMAATTGAIPTPLAPSHPVHPVTPKVSDDATDDQGSDATDQDASEDNGGLRDTCTQFTGGAFSDPTAAATSDSFRKLVIAAGGQDNVAAFCAALPATDDNQGEANDQGEHGNSANAPGHDPNGPGNSENAPGHNKGQDDQGQDQGNPGNSGHGNSSNAPGHNKSGHGNSANAPGHDPNGPGNSENAPGHNKSNSGQGNADDQGDDSGDSGHGNSGHGDGSDD
jgi:hypothetical protein